MEKMRFTNCYLKKQNRTIYFTQKINAYSVLQFCSAVNYFLSLNLNQLTIDFRKVQKVFPNGMLPVICSIDELRDLGIKIYIKLPDDDDIRKLFRSVNWAHFLSPTQFEKSDSTYDRHLVTRRFETAEQQLKAVNDFMDVVLRSMTIPKDIISGLEWSINEITDNVLNHSNSKHGGIIQASSHYKEKKIVFAVADSGRGILKSMQEGYPDLRTELDAIGEAIKAGVTRNPKFGQGNGLAGSLKIATLTGGSFEIISGNGRFTITQEQTLRRALKGSKFNGTLVSGEINIVDDFSISKALDFNQNFKYIPLDIIDLKYEMADSDCLLLKMKEETTGFGSRKSGVQIRTKVMNLISAKPNYPIIIDWDGVPVISSSFADEFIGKLFLELGAMTFSSIVKNKGMESLIRNLLDKAVSQRLTQADD
jgi:anti-sigma regulatory factor (Ser/Thr protein kinase)